jgi:ribulose 1,5-bisphosphate synthetase/thiazole synthase
LAGTRISRIATPTRPGTARRRPATPIRDQTGSKQSTANTHLVDAFDRGASILVGTTVDRVLVADGRAAGVSGTWTDPVTRRNASVMVLAPQVVVAAGSLE